MVYEIKEYNQEPQTDENPYPDTYTDREFPVFFSKEEMYEYTEKHNVFGIVFVYDNDEYLEYKDSDDYDVELPEIIEIIDL